MNLILFFLVFFSSLSALTLPDKPYQDVIVQGKVARQGYAVDCSARYEALKPILAKYNRPITVLDIGAAEGYFSFRIAQDYDAVCVMIGDPKHENNILQELCEENKQDTVILLSKRISASELATLSESEHFDVVIALNIIHHFGKNWKKAADAIFDLGDNILIETPPRNDKGACGKKVLEPIYKYLKKKSGTLLGKYDRKHTDPGAKDKLYWFEEKKRSLERRVFFHANKRDNRHYMIQSDYDNKSLTKYTSLGEVVTTTPWEPGINFMTFKALNGTYPLKETLKNAVQDLAQVSTTDWFPQNIIVQGSKCTLIDCNDPDQEKDAEEFSRVKLRKMAELIDCVDVAEFQKLYSVFGDSEFDFVIPHHPYQDIIIDGKLVKEGVGPDAQKRYQTLKPIFDRYKRPITVLDIGSGEGYFPFRISEDYDATCVMIGRPGYKDDILQRLCQQNQNGNVILLSKKVTPKDLKTLSESEHFDVVLALNIVHHSGKKWKEMIDAILQLGDQIIIETPPRKDEGAAGKKFLSQIDKYLKANKGKVIGRFARHTDPNRLDKMYLFEGKKGRLKRRVYIDDLSIDHYYMVKSSFEEKTLTTYTRRGDLISETLWHPGINFMTFKALNGTYPLKETLKETFLNLEHENGALDNFIIQGKSGILLESSLHEYGEEKTSLAFDMIEEDDLGRFKSLYEQFIKGN